MLLTETAAETVIADMGYDAQVRGVDPLEAKGKGVVIPSRTTTKVRRNYERHLSQARHLIENFFARLKQYRAIATRFFLQDSPHLSGRHPSGSGCCMAQLINDTP